MGTKQRYLAARKERKRKDYHTICKITMTKRYEQKGSLFLRSDHMDYGRATLVSNWHQAREAEHKDNKVFNNNTEQYDAKTRNVQKSTYNRILNITDGKLPIS